MARSKKGGSDLAFVPQRFTITFDIYPQIPMIRENALKLATNLAVHHELTDIHMSDESWEFRRPLARQGNAGLIRVVVSEDEVKLEHRLPNGGLERFEVLVEQVVQAMQPVIKPQILLGPYVSLEYLVDLGSDSRKAILGALDLAGDEDESGKLEVFERPCHFVGLRLGFPPFRIVAAEKEMEEGPRNEGQGGEDKPEGTEELMNRLVTPGEGDEGPLTQEGQGEERGADWQATLTVQSVQDEPKKMTVEVDGQWMAPIPWRDVPKTLAARLKTVDEFLRTKTSEFLKHFRSDE